MKKGIKIIEEILGTGPIVKRGNRIRIKYNLFLNRGDIIQENFESEIVLGDRSIIAGLNYGIEGMKEGGRRKFRVSPHLCYRNEGIKDTIPPDAVLIFDLELVKIFNT